jgi:hypothetical protein
LQRHHGGAGSHALVEEILGVIEIPLPVFGSRNGCASMVKPSSG